MNEYLVLARYPDTALAETYHHAAEIVRAEDPGSAVAIVRFAPQVTPCASSGSTRECPGGSMANRYLTCSHLSEVIPDHYHCAHCGSYEDGNTECENEHTIEVAGIGLVDLGVCCSSSWDSVLNATPEEAASILNPLFD